MSANNEDINPEFIRWAQENGVSLEYEEDWHEWFKCWLDGYITATRDVMRRMKGGEKP